jgi:hypothetical protein
VDPGPTTSAGGRRRRRNRAVAFDDQAVRLGLAMAGDVERGVLLLQFSTVSFARGEHVDEVRVQAVIYVRDLVYRSDYIKWEVDLKCQPAPSTARTIR